MPASAVFKRSGFQFHGARGKKSELPLDMVEYASPFDKRYLGFFAAATTVLPSDSAICPHEDDDESAISVLATAHLAVANLCIFHLLLVIDKGLSNMMAVQCDWPPVANLMHRSDGRY